MARFGSGQKSKISGRNCAKESHRFGREAIAAGCAATFQVIFVAVMSDPSRDIRSPEALLAESRQALASYWVKTQPVVAAYIAAMVRDTHGTEDLLQEVARIAAAKFEEFDASRSFTSWVLGIARYEILRFRRQHARSRMIFSESLLENLADRFESQSEKSEARRHALRKCLETVSERRRIVLEMRYQRDLRPQDIADRLGISSNAVLILLHRVRQALARCIGRRMAHETS